MKRSASHLRAIGYALAGFTLWVASDTFLKLNGEMAVSKYEVMAVSSLGGIAVMLTFTAVRREIHKLRPRKFSGLAALGFLHFINLACWYSALAHLPLLNIYVVTFLSPIIVAILAALFLHEHFSWKHGLAIIIGFAGVAFAINPSQLPSGSGVWTSYALGLASTILFSLQALILRILGPRETRECTAFYPRIIILLGSLSAGTIMDFGPMSAKEILYALASGGVGSLGWLCMAHAYKLAPAATIAPFQYSDIIVGALAGYIIWQDVPTMHLIVGAAIIVVCGIYIITHAQEPAKLLNEESHP